MRLFAEFGSAWSDMNAADRLRVVLAWGFIFGAVGHVGWAAIYHGDIWYYGPAPSWAPWFWYSICLVDFAVYWLLMTRPRAGIALSVTTMIVTLWVNWTQFPTFEFHFNYVLIGLTVFGVLVFATAPWLWTASKWRFSPMSSGHSGG